MSASGFGPYGDYVIPWLGRELNRLERLTPRSEPQRTRILERVYDLRTVLDDHIDEDEQRLHDAIDIANNARKRLDDLWSAHYQHGDDALLAVLPRADWLVPEGAGTISEFGRPQPLVEYLDNLARLTMAEVPLTIRHDEKWAPWRSAAKAIIAEQLAFTKHILRNNPDGVICLLRDALPVYLAARKMGVTAIGLPLNRAYLDRFGAEGSSYEIYDKVLMHLYESLSKYPDDSQQIWQSAGTNLRTQLKTDPKLAALATTLRQEADIPAGDFVTAETGLQGTIPLLTAAVFPQAKNWEMYTAGAWLLDAYQDNIFRHRYSVLRPVETLACTDNLFQVTFADGEWFAAETLDPTIKARADWEIAT
jgi:hypothetical protein